MGDLKPRELVNATYILVHSEDPILHQRKIESLWGRIFFSTGRRKNEDWARICNNILGLLIKCAVHTLNVAEIAKAMREFDKPGLGFELDFADSLESENRNLYLA